MSLKFCTTADAKRFMSLANPNATNFDAMINANITRVTKAIQRFCNREFVLREVEEFRATRAATYEDPFFLYTKERPIVGGVAAWYDAGFAVDYTTNPALLDTTMVINSEAGEVTFLFDTAERRRALKLVYMAGYARDVTDTDLVLVPSDIVDAASQQVAWLTNRHINREVGLREVQREGNNVRIEDDATNLLSEVKAVLVPYRRTLTDL